MNIKSDGFVQDEVKKVKNKNSLSVTQLIFWILIIVISVGLMWASIFAPEITGIIAVIVFFIGLNRLDAAMDFFKKVYKHD